MTSDSQGGGPPDSGARFGKYQIVRKLGQGAFGAVYEAYLPGPMGFTKRVAIKRLRSELIQEDERFVQSMVNEARIGGLLHHGNIVDVMEFDSVGDHYYIAMEFVDGLTLSEVIRICRRHRTLLPRFAILQLAIDVCKGLHHAHTLRDHDGTPLNVIHRDLKPANIMVNREGVAKICDFGIAKAASNLETTTTGMVKGTPRYMSPEQISAERNLGPRSDIYALGIVVYELITGRLLYDVDSLPALALKIVKNEMDEELDIGEEVFPGSRGVLERAMSKRPADRYPDAMALAGDLRELGRRYPAEADMAEVVARMLPSADRSGIRDIADLSDFERDARNIPDPTVRGPTGETPIPPADPLAAGWETFSRMFDSPTDTVPAEGADPTPAPATTRVDEPPTPPAEEAPADATVANGPAAPLAPPPSEDDLAPGGRASPLRWALPLTCGVLVLAGIGLALGGGLLGASRWGSESDARHGEVDAGPESEPGTGGGAIVAADDSGPEPAADTNADTGPATVLGSPAGETGDASAESPSAGEEREDADARDERESDVRDDGGGDEDDSASSEATPAAADEGDTAPLSPGTVSLRVVPWARIYVDGALVREEASALRKHPLDGGKHTIRAVCPDQEDRERTFEVTVDGEDVSLGCWDFKTSAPCVR